MKKILFIIGIFILFSCSKKIYVPVEKIITEKEVVRDTVIHTTIEKEYVKNVTPDTTSTVETKYSISTATYHGDTGILEHDIQNKQDSIPVEVKYIEKEVEKKVPEPYPVEVEKKIEVPTRMPLRWWEQILCYLGVAFIGYVGISIFSKLRK